ncbi:lipase family protein [Chitinophagaceae bacterium MMS25-I14]
MQGQHLQPGFDKEEYLELLRVSARHGDSNYFSKIEAPEHFRYVYTSPVMGLDNRWQLWTNQNVAVLSIRGTTTNQVSWLANFYAGMVPAKGSLVLSARDTFRYDLADNPKAGVHVGWLAGMAFLSRDMLPRIDSCYRSGIHDIIIMGHSQGGAIAFLLTAYLYNLQKRGLLPADIRFKTYCSAGPKPGNVYFAYDYEYLTRGGWAFNVVNSADWVPETPVSVQTVHDFNTTNPFAGAKKAIRKLKFPANLVVRHVYNRMDKPSRRAQRNFKKYLGKMAGKFILKSLPGYHQPDYLNSDHYVRTGVTIVLPADEEYYKHFPDSKTNIFVHHLFEPYIYLTKEKL